MNKINFILTLFVAMLVIASCEDNIGGKNAPDVPEGMSAIELRINGAYDNIYSRVAVDNGSLIKYPNLIHFLPDSSTMRLIVLNKDVSAGNGKIKESDIVTFTADGVEKKADYTYLIVYDKFGNPYPYPCDVDPETGEFIPGSVELEPYYLPAPTSGTETYYSMAISPAKEMVLNDGFYSVAVNNQESLLYTNNHWNQTKCKPFTVLSDVSKKTIIELNPLMHATARIRVKIVNGDHVHSLTAGYPYMEIDRVPTNPDAPWTPEDGSSENMPTYNLAVGDSIEAQLGNNILYNRIFVNDFSYEEIEHENSQNEISIVGGTTVLPMNTLSTPMIFRVNLEVNYTPMQFQFQSGKVFRAGFTYDYLGEVSLQDGNIYVVSWQDKQWTDDLYPQTE